MLNPSQKHIGAQWILFTLLLPILFASCAPKMVIKNPPSEMFTQQYASRQQDTHRIVNGNSQTVYVDFNDGQATQMSAAIVNGVQPMSSASEIQSLLQQGRLETVSSDRHFVLATLTHSYPYLVPKAVRLIGDIGERVQQLLGSDCRIIVTSLLRTRESVARLRRSNANAVSNSCHLYGTTFDIAYNSFDKSGPIPDNTIHQALRQALAEMKYNGRCYVMYEKNSKCYHITVR